MLFNSYGFIFIFLPITYLAAILLSRFHKNAYILVLTVASCVFYAMWDFKFLFLLLASAVINFGFSKYINESNDKNKKNILIFALIFNLTLLGYFKYINFFISEISALLSLQNETLAIILPLGISFYTFTQIAFLVDVYRGNVSEYSLTRYLLFVTYFPHLIAGPILHHKQMMPQFSIVKNSIFNKENIEIGLTIFIIGLVKKIFFADSFALFSTPVFVAANEGTILSFFEAWVGAISYTLQLYFDFSAYSNMAIGLSLIFNIKLPLNFNSPYKSRNIIDFWRSWHMTLSTFLRDYLYIPLGGNRGSSSRRYVNLMVTMVLGGLWHGAGWTFIIWGGLHGFYLIVNHLWRFTKHKLKIQSTTIFSVFLSQILTFLSVVVAWVFFRADNVTAALSILSSMFGMHGISIPNTFEPLFLNMANFALFNGISFQGIFPNQLFLYSNMIVIFAISFGLIIISMFPNTHQIMRNYSICWEDSVGRQVPSYTFPILIYQKMVWTASVKNGLLAGSLLFWILLLILNNKNSEFLYYQF